MTHRVTWTLVLTLFYVKNVEEETYRYTAEVGKISGPSHDPVEAVVGEVEKRLEKVLVVTLKLAATTFLVAVVLRHHRLHRFHVFQNRRCVWLQQQRCAWFRLKRKAQLQQGNSKYGLYEELKDVPL